MAENVIICSTLKKIRIHGILTGKRRTSRIRGKEVMLHRACQFFRGVCDFCKFCPGGEDGPAANVVWLRQTGRWR